MECVVGGTTSQFTYGPDGLRRSMTVDNGSTVETTHYLLDGQSVIMELQDVNSDGNFFDPSPPHSAEAGEVTALYAAGPRGIEFKIDAGGNRRWYLYDGLGSVLAEVDDNGNMTAQRKYDVYGAMRSGDQGSGSQKFCGALGHSTEPSTGGLIYMRARWYDPSVGRFVSEDPSKNGDNWYVYCDDSPATGVDKDGKLSQQADFVLMMMGTVFSPILFNAIVLAICAYWALVCTVASYGYYDEGEKAESLKAGAAATVFGTASGMAAYGVWKCHTAKTVTYLIWTVSGAAAFCIEVIGIILGTYGVIDTLHHQGVDLF